MKYAIGIDYGTLSARAVLVDTADGRVCSSSEYVYPHAVPFYEKLGFSRRGQTFFEAGIEHIEMELTLE